MLAVKTNKMLKNHKAYQYPDIYMPQAFFRNNVSGSRYFTEVKVVDSGFYFTTKWIYKETTFTQFILSSSKELPSWDKLQVDIFCKANRRRALQKNSTCSLTHDVSSLEDDNVFVFCVAFY
jgi:hypothetical protein